MSYIRNESPWESISSMTKRIFISADHGLAVVYFLQSEVVPTLLERGVEVVLLTDDALKEQIEMRFGRPGMVVEVCQKQWWLIHCISSAG
jgi:hypothetical protein